MTNPLARFLHPDGTARTRDGRVVEKLRSHREDNAGWLLGYVNGSQCLWNTSGMAGALRALDLAPAFTHPYAITGRAFTAEVWQTGEGDTARTHLRCTAIDERVRGKKRDSRIFNATNGWQIRSKGLLSLSNFAQVVSLRGEDRTADDAEATTPGHVAHAAAIALHEACEAWSAELNESEPAKPLPAEVAVKEELNRVVAVTLSSIKSDILLAELAQRLGGGA